MEEVLIILVRLLLPIIILRSPLIGVAFCIGVDFLDFQIIGEHTWYQFVDKALDLYYLSFCAFTVLSWKDERAKRIALGSYAWWFFGVLLLIATKSQNVLVMFPNFFELFFIFYILFVYFAKSSQLLTSIIKTWLIIASLLIPKILQEYALHIYVPQKLADNHALIPFFELPILLQFCIGAVIPVGVLVWCIMDAPLEEKE